MEEENEEEEDKEEPPTEADPDYALKTFLADLYPDGADLSRFEQFLPSSMENWMSKIVEYFCLSHVFDWIRWNTSVYLMFLIEFNTERLHIQRLHGNI